jgi:hypothetical protein
MVCQHTGWTWDYVDETLTVARLKALQDYWADNPPVQAMIAAYFGIKPEKKQSKTDFIQSIMHMPITRKI